MRKTLFFGLLVILSLSACKDDDDGDAMQDDCSTVPAVTENIIGTWESAANSDQVEFKTGGELIDDNDAILGVSDDEVETKTYSFIGTDSIEVSTMVDQGGSATARFAIENTDCDQIKLGLFGIDFPFNRVQ